jgi:hypothetical protein
MLSFFNHGQLLRHKYGGFYRTAHVIAGEPKGLDRVRWPEKVVLKHVWPFEQANQTRDASEMSKFEPVEEGILAAIMSEYTVEQYQQQVAESKRHGKLITEQYKAEQKA